jgi:hypothetical protein
MEKMNKLKYKYMNKINIGDPIVKKILQSINILNKHLDVIEVEVEDKDAKSK